MSIQNGSLKGQQLSLSENLIDLNSARGEKLLINSKSREDFFPLVNYFVTQDNLAYCGVASMVMVLNAISIPAPETPEYRRYSLFTQKNLFDNPKTKQVMTAEAVSKGGMTLEQLGKLLSTYPVNVNVYHGSELSVDEFRQVIINNLKESNNFVLVNYLRKTIAQETGGHISPIAAYNEETDRFLILDVARYKYPPIWVKAEELWESVNTTDRTSGKTRGLVLIDSLEN